MRKAEWAKQDEARVGVQRNEFGGTKEDDPRGLEKEEGARRTAKIG